MHVTALRVSTSVAGTFDVVLGIFGLGDDSTGAPQTRLLRALVLVSDMSAARSYHHWSWCAALTVLGIGLDNAYHPSATLQLFGVGWGFGFCGCLLRVWFPARLPFWLWVFGFWFWGLGFA